MTRRVTIDCLVNPDREGVPARHVTIECLVGDNASLNRDASDGGDHYFFVTRHEIVERRVIAVDPDPIIKIQRSNKRSKSYLSSNADGGASERVGRWGKGRTNEKNHTNAKTPNRSPNRHPGELVDRPHDRSSPQSPEKSPASPLGHSLRGNHHPALFVRPYQSKLTPIDRTMVGRSQDCHGRGDGSKADRGAPEVAA